MPPNSVVVGIPGRIVTRDGQRVGKADLIDLNHDRLPDPVSEIEYVLQEHIVRLEQRLTEIERQLNAAHQENCTIPKKSANIALAE